MQKDELTCKNFLYDIENGLEKLVHTAVFVANSSPRLFSLIISLFEQQLATKL